MALTGLDIYKLLPKTNCGECKSPTCLAFAMRVAQKQAFETFAIQSLISGLREQPDALKDSKRLSRVFRRLREELHREERRLQQEVRDAVVPVIHRIEVTAK